MSLYLLATSLFHGARQGAAASGALRAEAIPLRAALLLLAGLSAPVATAAAAGVEAVAGWVEAEVPAMMREAHLPGFSIAVVDDGETVYAQGFGARDAARNLPATPDTLFGIGSLTKSFVAIAVLQLAAEGRLRLDDPVARYVPLRLGDTAQPITIRHLLTHSPGFPNLGTSTVLISKGLGRDTGVPMASAADFYRFVNAAADEVVFAPGERFFYNNAAWRMLGHIVQAVSGLPFDVYVTRSILRPLGMQRSTFDTDALFADANHMVPHEVRDGQAIAAPFPYPNPRANPDFAFFAAAGGISSSANEMAAYLNALIDQGAHAEGRLLPAAAMAAMQSPQIAREAGEFGAEAYGYGLTVVPDFHGRRLISHGGSIAVSTAYMAMVPESGIGVVMLGNGPGMDYRRIAVAVLSILLDQPSAMPDDGVRGRMAAFTGDYATYEGLSEIAVQQRNGMLHLVRVGSDDEKRTRPLIPGDESYSGLDFYTLDGRQRTPVLFLRTDDGRQGLILERYVYWKR